MYATEFIAMASECIAYMYSTSPARQPAAPRRSDQLFMACSLIDASCQDDENTIAVTQIRGLRRQQIIVGVGYRGPNPDGKATCPFAAQFCEVEVNKQTGEVKIIRFVAAHDSGRDESPDLR